MNEKNIMIEIIIYKYIYTFINVYDKYKITFGVE